MLGAGSWGAHSPWQLVQRGSAEWGHSPGLPHGSCARVTHPGQPGCSPWLPSPYPHATRCCSTHRHRPRLPGTWGGGVLPTPKGGDGAPPNLSASSRQHVMPWPLRAALEDDLRCGASRAALPGSRWLPGLPRRARAAWQRSQSHVGPAGRVGSYSRQRGHCSGPWALLSPFVR